MSGGSYNYLCNKNASELRESEDDLLAMIDKINELGYSIIATDCKYLLHCINSIKIAESKIHQKMKDLYNVFLSVEWYVSGDFDIDCVETSMNDYAERNRLSI
jgi:hypothetical protein